MKIKIYIALALLIGFSLNVSAQAPGFDTSVDDVTAPIPGIVLAAIVALGLGVKKALKK
jgi:hypothetical protein